jgi:multidrug efflux pump subunit AcrB
MNKLLEGAIKNKKITIFFVVVVVLMGLYSYYVVPKQEAPDLSAPYAIMTTIYPGASQVDVEKRVTKKIEDEVSKIEGYEYAETYSSNNVSVVVLKMKYGTDPDEAWKDLRIKMDDLQSDLPSECYDIELNTDVVETAGMIISLTGENYSYEELAYYADEITKDLSEVDGISKFEVEGELDHEIEVEVDYKKLNYNKLSLDELKQLIQAQNVQIPFGEIENDNSKITIKTDSSYKSAKDIEDILIGVSRENGSVLKLKDIANVHEKLDETSPKYRDNGKAAVLISGYFEDGKNVILVGKDVENKIEELKRNLPSDLTFNEVLYQPKDVALSVNNFIMNLIQSVLLVIVVVLIGLGLRNALIISTAIPVSMLMTFAVLPAMGIKVHQVSIAGMIVALGMLVDNAIVVSDSIQIRIDNDEDKLKACVNGTKDVAVSVFASTLTTVAAFSPLLMLDSLAGDYVASLPKVVMLALTGSYITAIFITPTMAFLFSKKRKEKIQKYRLRAFFTRMLNRSLEHKGMMFMCILLVIGGTVFLLSKLPIIFFPKADKSIVYVDIKAEKNIGLDYTKNVVEQVESVLKEQPEVVGYASSVGSSIPRFYDTLRVMVEMVDNAQILVNVDLSESERYRNNTQFVEALQARINGSVTGGEAIVKELEYAEPIGHPIKIRLSGENYDILEAASEQIQNVLNATPGTINVNDDYGNKNYAYSVEIDKEKASLFGISNYDIQNEVSMALRGREASVLRKDDSEKSIIVKTDIQTVEDLENLKIKSRITGKKVLLKNVAHVVLETQLPTILRYDRDYAITAFSDVKTGYNRRDIVGNLKTEMSKMDLSGVRVTFDGEDEMIKKYFGNLGVSAIFAAIAIFVILLVQFKSFSQPFVILCTIPLSAIGSILGLFITRQPLSFTGLLGMISLMGIVVNNAIVLVDFINKERADGKDKTEACKAAIDKRFRPIVLSTITTVIGLIPLAISESQLFKPLAIALMFGLVVSTLLTLVVIPTTYTILERE